MNNYDIFQIVCRLPSNYYIWLKLQQVTILDMFTVEKNNTCMLKGKERKLFKEEEYYTYFTRMRAGRCVYFRFVANTRKKAKQPERVCACDA